jgi:hypothetical protein
MHRGWAMMKLDLASDRELRKIGLQLYTVRDLLTVDFEETLKRVAILGYREVESPAYSAQTSAAPASG